VIERLEIKLRRSVLPLLHFKVRLVVAADRRRRVRHIGNRALHGVDIGFEGRQFLAGRGALVAEFAPLGLQRFALFRSFRLADELRRFVGLTVQLVDLLLHLPTLHFQLDEAIDVGFGVAAGAVLFDECGVFYDEFAVEHDSFSA
jgi:hypothetical protein